MNFKHVRADSLEKTHAGKDWGKEEKGASEDEMVGWHHQLNGYEFEQTLRNSEGQGGKPGLLQSMESQRVGHDWATEQQQSIWLYKCFKYAYLYIYISK